MISTLLIWLYIAVTAGIVGKTVLAVFRCHLRSAVSAELAGLAGVTVFAQIWSLFGGVGLAANLVLMAGCFLITACAVLKKGTVEVFSWIGRGITEIREHPAKTMILMVSILVLALGTSAGNWHIDTPLYHAQSIHWIETYGQIPGLGNLQSDFAYNNACFSLYALYSFAWLGGQSFHAVQGFLAVLLLFLCLSPVDRGSDGTSGHRLSPAFFLRLAAMLQIVFLYDELVSPSSDCFILLLVHVIFLLWTELSEKDGDEVSPVPFALVAMLSVYAVTVKLAAAPTLLLAFGPAAALLFGKSRDLRCFLRFVLTALLIVLPFFARGILISGWLLYPAVALHGIELPWRIPDGVGIFESFEIRQNGRMIFDMDLADTSLTGWIPGWFAGQTLQARLLILAAGAAVFITILRLLLRLVDFLKKRKIRGTGVLFTETVLAGCLLFWFFTTPQMRFGEAYLLIMSALVAGDILCAGLNRFGESLRKRAEAVMEYGPAVFLAAALGFLLVTGQIPFSHPVLQQDYDRYPVTAYRVDGIKLYYPTDYVYTGYYAFPGTRWKNEDIRALGAKITDGFTAKQ